MKNRRTRVSENVLQFDAAWVARCAAQTEAAMGFSSEYDDDPLRAALRRAIRQVWKTELTPCQRAYFRGYYLEHRTMKAIAQQHGVTESTVSRTLHRARRRLQQYLSYYDFRLRSEEQ